MAQFKRDHDLDNSLHRRNEANHRREEREREALRRVLELINLQPYTVVVLFSPLSLFPTPILLAFLSLACGIDAQRRKRVTEKEDNYATTTLALEISFIQARLQPLVVIQYRYTESLLQ